MQRFDANRQGAIPSTTLYQQVVSSGGSVLQAYLCCSRVVTGTRIFCLHLPTQFISSLDGAPTPWDNKSFAFKGEAIQGLISVVQFPTNAFDEVDAYVRPLAYMLEHQDELDDAPCFPPAYDNDEDSEEVTTRNCIFLPAVYVPLLLRPSGYSAKEVWRILYPAIETRNETETCTPLLQWLQVASTSTVGTTPALLGDPSNAITLTTPATDEVLMTHCHSILNRALPGLSAPPQTLETALSQMASALVAQTNDSRQARELKLATEQDPKLPSDRFTITLPVLMDYLLIDDERNLPDVWHQWANSKKRQELQVLRDALDAFARSPDAYTPTVPIITARLTQDMLNFNFVGQSADDLKGGLHPFIIADGNAEHRQTNLEVARLYGLLTAGDAACSLADLEALSAKEVHTIPVTYWELEVTLGMFGNLLAVLLGTQHPITTAYRQMWLLMQSQLKTDLHTVMEYKAYVKPTHLLRSIQLSLYTWFTHKRAHLTPPTLDFVTVLQDIIMQRYTLPHLPPPSYTNWSILREPH
jgi:hypothetical protein